MTQPVRNSHCAFCGHRFESLDLAWPRRCTQCGSVSYLNPLPVAVLVIPVGQGVLTIRRTIEPRKGSLALPGGFIEVGERWQEAAVREAREETGLEIDAASVSLVNVHSAPDGTVLIFGACPAFDTLPPFEATGEASERRIVTEPVELAFELHSEVLKAWFEAHPPAAPSPETGRRFDVACRGGDVAQASALLEAYPALAQRTRPLIEAAGRGDEAVVRVLLDAGADPAAPEPKRGAQRPLFQCLAPKGEKHAGHVKVLEALVGAGAKLDVRGAYQGLGPLCLAAAGGHGALVEALQRLDAPADIFAAVMCCDAALVRRLLEQTPGLLQAKDAKGRGLLHALGLSRLWQHGEAKARASLDVARLLLDAGADIDQPTHKDGPPETFRPTALWWAVSSGRHEELVRYLLSRGANPSVCLAAAAFQNHVGVMEALVDAGASVDERSNKHCTPLHDCLLFARPGAIGWLLEHGADPNLKTPEGLDAGHLAAVTGAQVEVLELLAAHGVDFGAVDGQGRSARDLASARGHQHVLAWLDGAQGVGGGEAADA